MGTLCEYKPHKGSCIFLPLLMAGYITERFISQLLLLS